MDKLILYRGAPNMVCTIGSAMLNGRRLFYTLELPWNNNQPDKSCIPPGVYTCEWDESPSKGWCYHVRSVPGREHILIHIGNYPHNTLGCILPGLIRGVNMVGSSGDAIKLLENTFKRQPFQLVIS